MGDISFSALIHSLMNFYSGTTQAGDNKFVSLMLVCARHMAKAGTQWGCKRYMNMKHLEAALDDANVTRYARYMRTLAGKTQFIVITHRRGTMEEADVLYGVTMQEQGVSKILTINLNDMAKELKIK